MKSQSLHLLAVGALLLSSGRALAQDKATKEQAEKLHAQAQNEQDQPKAVKLFCKAAELVPKNQDYQNDCTATKASLLRADKRALTQAQTAADAGHVDSAKLQAGYVSDVDPDMYKRAQQLIAKLNAPAQPPPQQQQPQTPVQQDKSTALFAQANSDFESGNLQGAKAAASQVTDASLKPMAARVIENVDKYSGLVSEGQRAEGSNPQAALSAYESARNINSHVAGDDLNGKIQRLQAQIAAANHPVAPPAPVNPTPVAPTPVVAKNNTPPPPKPEVSPEDKKKQMMAVYAAALGRKDTEGAEKALRQVTQLDPRDTQAKAQLDALDKQLADQLNHDPAKLEQTLHDAIVAFYGSDFDTADSKLNTYLRASGGKKKGVAYFYLGATEQAQAYLEPQSRRAKRFADARDNFRQARQNGYQPVTKYVSEKILQAWQQAGA